MNEQSKSGYIHCENYRHNIGVPDASRQIGGKQRRRYPQNAEKQRQRGADQNIPVRKDPFREIIIECYDEQ